MQRTQAAMQQIFQSTLLMRGATMLNTVTASSSIHFNPRSSCEERRGKYCFAVLQKSISIHAPHARSDKKRVCTHARQSYFNPRSSCEERLCYFQALICLTSSYIFREPLTSFRKHFF